MHGGVFFDENYFTNGMTTLVDRAFRRMSGTGAESKRIAVATTGQALQKGVWTPNLRVVIIDNHHHPERPATMATARLFQSGRSQAVRLPKEFRFDGTEVAVRHFGNGVLLLPLDDPWQTLENGLAAFEPGFTLQREQPALQARPDIVATARRP